MTCADIVHMTTPGGMSGTRASRRLAVAALLLALPVAAGFTSGRVLAVPWAEPAGWGAADGAPLVTRGPTVPLPAADGAYAFLLTGDDGSPVRWDPCRPVPVVVGADGGPDGGVAMVTEVLDDLSNATGLRLVVEGTTGERPDVDRPSHQPERYGDRWAPVLVAWADEEAYPALQGDRVGVAAPVAVDPRGSAPARYVTGSVVLESSWFRSAVQTGDGRDRAAGVLKHELGHLVGLDHVDDPVQLMSPVYQSLPDWSAGDRAGLAVAGAGPCLEPHDP